MTKKLILSTIATLAFSIASAQTTAAPAAAPANSTIANPGGANTNFGTVNPNGTANSSTGINAPAGTPTNNTATSSANPAMNTTNPNMGTNSNMGTSSNMGVNSNTGVNTGVANSTGTNATAYGVPAANAPMSANQIRSAQSALSTSGYATQADGVLGGRTADAIRSYQRNNGLTQSGVFDDATLRALQLPGNDMRAPASVNDNQ